MLFYFLKFLSVLCFWMGVLIGFWKNNFWRVLVFNVVVLLGFVTEIVGIGIQLNVLVLRLLDAWKMACWKRILLLLKFSFKPIIKSLLPQKFLPQILLLIPLRLTFQPLLFNSMFFIFGHNKLWFNRILFWITRLISLNP